MRDPVRWMGGLVCAVAAMAAHAAPVFASPDDAMTAFGEAVVHDDEAALRRMLGNGFRRFVPPEGAWVRGRFVEVWQQSHALQPDGDVVRVAVGQDGWTLPIPIVKSGEGWRFDTVAGDAEMRVRRIGRHERVAIDTLLTVLDAQREYASVDRDGDGVLHYADRLVSSPERHDGLYWPTVPGEVPSPLGPAFVGAEARNASATGLLGYRYKLLTAQGPHAPGGALDYRVRGKLFGGFAVLAWPVRHGDSGVMAFLMNHDGDIYQQDLGAKTAARAGAISRFDPGPGWTKVVP